MRAEVGPFCSPITIRDRLATSQGDTGSLTIYGDRPMDHRLLAEHLTSESRTKTIGNGRAVDVWKLKSTTADNHWLDCLVGCAAAASVQGCALPGLESQAGRQRPQRARLSDLQRKRA